MVFQFYIKKGKINGIEHAGGVRRGVASIYDRSFDLISILGKIDFGSNSHIGISLRYGHKRRKVHFVGVGSFSLRSYKWSCAIPLDTYC